MDTIFRDLVLTGEVMVYMDDILIATDNNLTHHCYLVHQVLQTLEEHDLFLKPQKCQFEVDEVEYLIPRSYPGPQTNMYGPCQSPRRTRLAYPTQSERYTWVLGILQFLLLLHLQFF
jgi:hypothetical protein